MTVTLAGPVHDWDALAARWRALEAQVTPSFFQSWTWVGCLARERYPDPLLVEARRDGQTVALALFNRRRGLLGDALVLHATGDVRHDSPYVEHNAVLGDSAEAVLRMAMRGWPPRRLLLPGIDRATLDALRRAGGRVRVIACREAPFADLTHDYLSARSANTRQQIRRSDRAYGAVAIQRAETLADARRYLDALSELHQESWVRRGQPGAFASEFFCHFHHTLLERGMPRGEIDLLRITGDGRVLGLLYNFRFRHQMLAYQSGLDYRHAGGARKPGITCHHAAIRLAAAEGLQRYDFLAGADRYKRSLSDRSVPLYWVEAATWHPGSTMRRLLDRLHG